MRPDPFQIPNPIKYIYTGDGFAPNDVYQAAMDAAGDSYAANADTAKTALDVVSAVDPTPLSDGVKVTLLVMEGNNQEAKQVMVGAINPLNQIQQVGKVGNAIGAATSAVSTAAIAKKAAKVNQLKINQAAGKAAEIKVINTQLPKTQTNIQKQITIKSNGPTGTKVKMDAVGNDSATGMIKLTEVKASPTSPLTPKQTIGIPEIEASGGTVVGKGKPPFIGGTPIPPTKTDIIMGPFLP